MVDRACSEALVDLNAYYKVSYLNLLTSETTLTSRLGCHEKLCGQRMPASD